MLFATTALDALLTSGQAFLGDGAKGCHLCSAAGSVVPMNIKYFEARCAPRPHDAPHGAAARPSPHGPSAHALAAMRRGPPRTRRAPRHAPPA